MSLLGERLREELEQRGWTYRELADRTKELAQKLTPADEGISFSQIGSIVRGETREPGLRHLWLLSEVLGWKFADTIEMAGYSLGKVGDSDPRRARVAAILSQATDDQIVLIERLLNLNADNQQVAAAYLAGLEAAQKAKGRKRAK